MIATRAILNRLAVEGCPFCLDNGKVTVIARSNGYYLAKVIGENEHYFVIPVVHAEHFMELDNDWFGDFKQLVVQIPWYHPDAPLNITMNQYQMAGQRVSHVHWWIVYRGDGSGGGLGLAGLATEYDKAHAVS